LSDARSQKPTRKIELTGKVERVRSNLLVGMPTAQEDLQK
jgi:hypothetical protein